MSMMSWNKFDQTFELTQDIEFEINALELNSPLGLDIHSLKVLIKSLASSPSLKDSLKCLHVKDGGFEKDQVAKILKKAGFAVLEIEV